MPQTTGSLGLKRQSSGDLPLLFSPSVDDQRLDQLGGDESKCYEPTLEVQRVKLSCVLSSDAERKLSLAVQEAKACSILQTGASDLAQVGRYLRSKYGYLVYVRHANMQRRAKTYLRMLRHDFLVVRGVEGAEGADLLVDLNFKDNFILPHTTQWYSQLVPALPQDWFGSAEKLVPVLEVMSAAIRLCFKQLGVPLPPWREPRALLSKWLCEVFVDEPLPVVPLPDSTLRRMLAPYHKPFRAAVNSAATWPEQQQQLGPVVAVRTAPLPPLPRPCSNVALATSAIRAAAAAAVGAALAGSHGAHRVLGHNSAVTADVPRRIIVGFPDQHMKAATQQQQADADVYLQRHQQQLMGKQQTLVAQQGMRSSAVPSAAWQEATASAAADEEETVRNGQYNGGLKALPQHHHINTATAVPERSAAAMPKPLVLTPAGCEAYVRVVGVTDNKSAAYLAGKIGQHHKQQQQPPLEQTACQMDAPSFSTCGVVTAVHTDSPAILANNQLLQPHTETSTAGAEVPTAGVAAAGGVHRFKPLDQLLPKMKVIKLGC